MVMDTLQIRLGHASVERIDKLIEEGMYANRSDAIREAVRHYFWHREVGTITPIGDAVAIIRKAREKLSKEKIDLDEINAL